MESYPSNMLIKHRLVETIRRRRRSCSPHALLLRRPLLLPLSSSSAMESSLPRRKSDRSPCFLPEGRGLRLYSPPFRCPAASSSPRFPPQFGTSWRVAMPPKKPPFLSAEACSSSDRYPGAFPNSSLAVFCAELSVCRWSLGAVDMGRETSVGRWLSSIEPLNWTRGRKHVCN